jgi:2-polyprenyl-3-methyl-5-hydroxy-6-metoxy-1,4-benzoquinol methylase
MNHFWNERYAEKEFAYGILPNEFLKNTLEPMSLGKILFVCEGEGRNAVYAAQKKWEVTAFDLSEEGKNKALSLAHEKNLTLNYQIGDAVVIEYPENTFDCITLIYAHFPATFRQSIHQKTVKWLKPNGTLILEAFNPDQLANSSGGPKELSMLYTIDMIKEDFNGLTINTLKSEEIELNEGKYHQGKANVIRFIGKK